MAKMIQIDDDVFEGLKVLAEPLVDDPNSVIKKLLGEYSLSRKTGNNLKNSPAEMKAEDFWDNSELPERDESEVKISYEFSRLCFLAKHIEPLEDSDIFQVVTTRDGTFQLTKADFYNTFPNVLSSKSYQQNGIYHYPKVPEKAKAFRVRIRGD